MNLRASRGPSQSAGRLRFRCSFRLSIGSAHSWPWAYRQPNSRGPVLGPIIGEVCASIDESKYGGH